MHCVKCYLMGKRQPTAWVGLGLTVPLLLSWVFLPLTFNPQPDSSVPPGAELTHLVDEQPRSSRCQSTARGFSPFYSATNTQPWGGMQGQGQGDQDGTSTRILRAAVPGAPLPAARTLQWGHSISQAQLLPQHGAPRVYPKLLRKPMPTVRNSSRSPVPSCQWAGRGEKSLQTFVFALSRPRVMAAGQTPLCSQLVLF